MEDRACRFDDQAVGRSVDVGKAVNRMGKVLAFGFRFYVEWDVRLNSWRCLVTIIQG